MNNLIFCFHSASSSGSSGVCAQSCARTYINCAMFKSKSCTSETNTGEKQHGKDAHIPKIYLNIRQEKLDPLYPPTHPPTHPRFHSNLPGPHPWPNKGSADIQENVPIITKHLLQLHGERRHIKGKVARQQGDA